VQGKGRNTAVPDVPHCHPERRHAHQHSVNPAKPHHHNQKTKKTKKFFSLQKIDPGMRQTFKDNFILLYYQSHWPYRILRSPNRR
jgi:hypothetical protein